MVLKVAYLGPNFVGLLRKLSLPGLNLGFTSIVVRELTLDVFLLLFGFLNDCQLSYITSVQTQTITFLAASKPATLAGMSSWATSSSCRNLL